MHEDKRVEFLRFRPERIVLGRRQRFARDMPANGRAAQPQLFYGVLELLRRQVGKLQRH